MRRKNTKQLTDSILGQHIALSVAAGLARTQLVPDPLTVYDAQHLSETLEVVARALTKVAPVYVHDSGGAEPRQLMQADLEDAVPRRGATLLVLKDGRSYSSVTMRRGDLRQAIAVLKAVGIPELAVRRPPAAEEPRAPAPDLRGELLGALLQIEALLRPPLVPAQVERASRIALTIARKAPQGRVSNLAMQLMSGVHEARSATERADDGSVRLLLARLRVALDETVKPPARG